jgi:hypothetical protein
VNGDLVSAAERLGMTTRKMTTGRDITIEIFWITFVIGIILYLFNN